MTDIVKRLHDWTVGVRRNPFPTMDANQMVSTAAATIESLRQQLAEKDAEIEFQKNAHGQAHQLLLEQGHQLAALQQRINELENDAERLDWIDKKLFEHHWNGVVGNGSATYWRVISAHRHIAAKMIGQTFRAAIDAALEQKEIG